MDIYVALRDDAETKGGLTTLIGAFDFEADARAACREDYDEDNEGVNMPPLAWHDDWACTLDGSRYWVRQITRNERTVA